ncbi:MAG: hypothetical protein ACI4J0_08055 [Huintestinicola sp.]|uniref:hypothetical protein n=1 Tax=Huintestinicola sp. TaxID=2981661 RepID=UPI003F02E1CB
MSNKKEKLFDPASIGIEPQETAGDLISDKGLDEMQKAESYKLTFGIFKTSFWIWIIISMAMMATAELGDNTNVPLSVFGIIIELIDMTMYIFYAAKTSSKGLMREKFAKAWGKKGIIILYLALGIMYMSWFYSMSIFFRLYIGLVYISFCIVGLYAIRNNKVVEKLNSEE